MRPQHCRQPGRQHRWPQTKGADSERAQHDARVLATPDARRQKAESAAGIGETDGEDHGPASATPTAGCPGSSARRAAASRRRPARRRRAVPRQSAPTPRPANAAACSLTATDVERRQATPQGLTISSGTGRWPGST